MRATSISATWGTTADERSQPFPCDPLLPNPDAELYRGVTVNAPPARVFRWLCQLRAAPYSYDRIDNGGRPSPRHLIPGLQNLAPGQDVMRIFTLVDYETDRHLTFRTKRGSPAQQTFGEVCCTYLVVPQRDGGCRLLVKFLVRYPPGLRGMLMRRVLPWGDLVMMRRQLLNLKRFAEEEPLDTGDGR